MIITMVRMMIDNDDDDGYDDDDDLDHCGVVLSTMVIIHLLAFA